MDTEKIAAGVKLILEGIGEEIDRDGLNETPQRVAQMFTEILSETNTAPTIEAGFAEKVGDDLIQITDIPFYSMCEHHLLPFFGRVHIAYVPQHNKVAGFSTIARLVENYAKRLQLQERLTHQIADVLMEGLEAKGVFVVIEAQQLCVSMRGNRKDTVRTTTQAIRGEISLERLMLNKSLSSSSL